MNQTIKTGLASLVCLSVLPFSVSAEDVLEVVVTANRKAISIDETISPVTVITRRDIENSQATELTDVLRNVVGINVSSTGGLGATSSIFLRGTNSDHVLVLIDGVKVGSATIGATAFETLELEQVERIEIVRGPRSSLYGSEAIGGVIQIFTRRAKDGGNVSASVGFGNNGTYKSNANLSTRTDSAWFNLNASSLKTDGIDAKYFDSFSNLIDTETDKDGLRRESFSLRAGKRTEQGVSAEIIVNKSVGDAHYDGSFQNQTDFDEQAVTAKLSVPLAENATLKAQYGTSQDNTLNYLNGAFSSEFNTARNQLGVALDAGFGKKGDWQIGVDELEDSVSGSTNYTVSSRKNTGVYVNYRNYINNHHVDVALRQDDNEQFGRHNTGSLAWGYDFNAVRLTAAYGTAFKAPTFNDLYFPFFGNENLKPEKSNNIEIGLSGDSDKFAWSASLFNNQIEDLIAGFPVDNIAEAEIKGLELSAASQVAGWNLKANATFQEPKNASGANDGKLLRRRPEQIVNLDLSRDFGKASFAASIHGESKRYEDAANTSKLAGFATLNLRGSYELNNDWKVSARVDNVLDKDYETVQGYNQLGVNGMITLHYSPK